MVEPSRLSSLHRCLTVAAIMVTTPVFAADPNNGERIAHRWCEACHVVTPTQTRATTDQAPPFFDNCKETRL